MLCRWAVEQGQDFVTDCGQDNVDFCSIHLWPDNWLVRPA